MLKTFIFILMFPLASLIQAQETKSFYQIDLIVFAQQQAPLPSELSLHSTLSSNPAKGIALKTEVSKTISAYHLLPSSSSHLQEEYWALHRKHQVLLHYSWLQPLNNQKTLVLPKIQRNGWEIEGTLGLQRSNYYLLNSELLVSAPGSQSPFVLSHRQRLKGGDIYYFDHPQAGMLIKVHQLS